MTIYKESIAVYLCSTYLIKREKGCLTFSLQILVNKGPVGLTICLVWAIVFFKVKAIPELQVSGKKPVSSKHVSCSPTL